MPESPSPFSKWNFDPNFTILMLLVTKQRGQEGVKEGGGNPGAQGRLLC